MPVTPQDRPIDALREETVDQLIMNYGHGKLSREAFERRLDEALDTKSHERLIELTEDLDLRTDRQYTSQKKAELGIRVDPSARAHVDEADTIVNVFAGHNRRGAWDVPRAIRMINVFGGCELDFTDARFTAETTYITVFCLFGGVNLRVRDGMRTISKALCIFGGVDNRGGRRSIPTRRCSSSKVLLFGGVDIRVKKTPKQRLQEFADHRDDVRPARSRRARVSAAAPALPRQCASGSGLIWKCTALPSVPLPPSVCQIKCVP